MKLDQSDIKGSRMNKQDNNANELKKHIRALEMQLQKAKSELGKIEGKSALTDLIIRKMKAGASLADIGDHRGLRVRRGKTGTTVFTYRYRSPESGKLKQIKIGSYPETSLADARKKLTDLKAKRGNGICPATQKALDDEALKRQQKAEQAERKIKSITVKDVVDHFLRNYIEDRVVVSVNNKGKETRKTIKGARKSKGQAECKRSLEKDVSKTIGDIPATELMHADVTKIINSMLARGNTVQAGIVLKDFSQAFDYCIGTGFLPDETINPCIRVKKKLKDSNVKLTPNKRKRTFSDVELTLFVNWLPNSRFTPIVQNAFMLTLFTGCRTGEVVSAKWSDINLETGTLNLNETKTGVDRAVQLSTQAVELLEVMPKDSAYLFPAKMDNTKPISQRQLAWQCMNIRIASEKKPELWLQIPHWTPHDLRRTVRTGLSRMRCPSEVAEAILGHARSGIEGTYDLHGYEAESREWLQRWADHLDKLQQDGVST